jgi:hypothetical protein
MSIYIRNKREILKKILKKVGGTAPVKNAPKKKQKREKKKQIRAKTHTKKRLKKDEKSHVQNTTTEKDSNGGDMKTECRTQQRPCRRAGGSSEWTNQRRLLLDQDAVAIDHTLEAGHASWLGTSRWTVEQATGHHQRRPFSPKIAETGGAATG